MNIRKTINWLLGGYTILMLVVAAFIYSGYTVPFADYIVLGGGGMVIVAITLMVTTFREDT